MLGIIALLMFVLLTRAFRSLVLVVRTIATGLASIATGLGVVLLI
jgi:hypothetical protein